MSMPNSSVQTVGVVADTHGFFHPALASLFKGVSLIVHAGDVGAGEVLDRLEKIAPVKAVRGNYDRAPELASRLLPDPSMIELLGMPALLTHALFTMNWEELKGEIAKQLLRAPTAPRIVIFGHTHFPVAEEVEGIMFVNPGYCGPDEIEGPRTAALLKLENNRLSAEVVRLPRLS